MLRNFSWSHTLGILGYNPSVLSSDHCRKGGGTKYWLWRFHSGTVKLTEIRPCWWSNLKSPQNFQLSIFRLSTFLFILFLPSFLFYCDFFFFYFNFLRAVPWKNILIISSSSLFIVTLSLFFTRSSLHSFSFHPLIILVFIFLPHYFQPLPSPPPSISFLNNFLTLHGWWCDFSFTNCIDNRL